MCTQIVCKNSLEYLFFLEVIDNEETLRVLEFFSLGSLAGRGGSRGAATRSRRLEKT